MWFKVILKRCQINSEYLTFLPGIRSCCPSHTCCCHCHSAGKKKDLSPSCITDKVGSLEIFLVEENTQSKSMKAKGALVSLIKVILS